MEDGIMSYDNKSQNNSRLKTLDNDEMRLERNILCLKKEKI